MEYRILGPLEVADDGQAVAVGGRRQRAVLVALLLRANTPVPVDTLVDQLWGDRPPPSAVKIVQNCVSQVRQSLASGSLVTHPNGYELRVEDGELDRAEFERLLKDGRGQLALGRPDEAAQLLRTALALWRGPPLADYTHEPFAQREIARLTDLRLAGMMDRIDAELALGRAVDVVDDLEQLVVEHPLNERLREQLMLALYRTGRQARALQVYREGRHTLLEELGVDPGPALKRLEQAILTQDPNLDQDTPSLSDGPRRRTSTHRRWGLAVVVVAATLVAGSTTFRLLGSDDGGAPSVSRGSVALFDPRTLQPTGHLTVDSRPVAIAAGHGAVWVLSAGQSSLTSIDPSTNTVVNPSTIVSTHAGGVTSLAYIADTPWAVDSTTGDLIRVGGYSGALTHTSVGPAGYYLLAAGNGAVWVASNDPARIVRVDARTGDVTARIRTPGSPVGLAVANGAIWTISVDANGRNLLSRIDASTLRIAASVSLPAPGTAIAAGFGALWVALNSTNLLLRIDPATNSIERTIDVGDGPNRVTTGLGSVWVTDMGDQTLRRIDPRTNRVAATRHFEGVPLAVLAANKAVWIVGV